TGEVKLLTPANRDVISGTATADGRQWSLVIGGVDTPGDLFHFDSSTGALTRVFSPNAEFLSGLALGEVEELWVDAFDGKKLQGWIVKPPGFDPKKKYPLVLEIHGGPYADYGPGFAAEIQLYAAAGYVVLYTNPRGSTGYGEAFAQLINGDYPGHDYD